MLPSLTAIALALALIGYATPAHAQATSVQVCGALHGYAAASARTAGELTLGTSRFTIAAGTTNSSANIPGRVGDRLCMIGTLGAGGSLTSLGFSPFPPRYCGHVAKVTHATSSASGELILGQTAQIRMIIPFGVPLAVAPGESRCFETGLTAEGDMTALNVGQDASGSAGGGELKQLPGTSTHDRVDVAAPLLGLTIASLWILARRRAASLGTSGRNPG